MTKRQVEVITSVERRRRWSREDKERLVSACLEPGAVLSEIARSAGIHVSQLFRWRKELCQVPAAPVQQLAPVQVVEALPVPSLTVRPSVIRPRKKTSVVTIELGGGRRIRVESDVDIEALGRILNVLERR
ncbi:IS66-like element accessory protein TnpA [Ciceribacter selenitireducens]|uniref:IS66-like element accessory protein TnpA n=1 Tax=Ciceribacter selenitireducens TaxID=448181 RepID=UPI0015F26CEF|nr:transposase [Ciceribacter selenitireducens]